MKNKKNRKKRRKNSKLIKFSKIHSIITVVIFVLYLAAGLLYSPVFLKEDLKMKYASASSNLSFSQRIYGFPQKPVLVGTSGCVLGHSFIRISWNADNEALYFEVYRNGEISASGITSNSYTDNAAVNPNEYSYEVVAKGFSNDETSDPLTISTSFCEEEKPDPTIQISSFVKKSVTIGVSSTSDRTPAITGSTNISNAQIDITVSDGRTIIAQTTANSVGYWSWSPSSSLSYGLHTMRVIATDPEDSERSTSTNFVFRIRRPETEDEIHHDKKEEQTTEIPGIMEENKPENPLGKDKETKEIEIPKNEKIPKIDVIFESQKENKIEAGNLLKVRAMILNREDLDINQEVEISYRIISADEKEMIEITDIKKLSNADEFSKEIKIPKNLKAGNYKVKVSMVYGAFDVSNDKTISISEPIIINLGGAAAITYSELVNNLGWILILALLMLITMLFMLLLEYFYYSYSLFDIDENNLWRSGFFGDKK